MTTSHRPQDGAVRSTAGGGGGSATNDGKRFSKTAASYANGSSIPPGQTGHPSSSSLRPGRVERSDVPRGRDRHPLSRHQIEAPVDPAGHCVGAAVREARACAKSAVHEDAPPVVVHELVPAEGVHRATSTSQCSRSDSTIASFADSPVITMSISSVAAEVGELDAADLASVGEDDASAGNLEHSPLDLCLWEVDVRHAAGRVHAVAADEQRAHRDPLEDVRRQRVDEGVLKGPQRAAENDDGDPRDGMLQLERGLEPVREDHDVAELGAVDESVGGGDGCGADVDDDRVAVADQFGRRAADRELLEGMAGHRLLERALVPERGARDRAAPDPVDPPPLREGGEIVADRHLGDPESVAEVTHPRERLLLDHGEHASPALVAVGHEVVGRRDRRGDRRRRILR